VVNGGRARGGFVDLGFGLVLILLYWLDFGFVSWFGVVLDVRTVLGCDLLGGGFVGLICCWCA
jgi:hypothetical protein